MSDFFAVLWGVVAVAIMYVAVAVPIGIAEFRHHNQYGRIGLCGVFSLMVGLGTVTQTNSILWGVLSCVAINVVLSLYAYFSNDTEDKYKAFDPNNMIPDPVATEAVGLLVSISVLKGTKAPFEATVQDVYFENVARGKLFAEIHKERVIGTSKVRVGV